MKSPVLWKLVSITVLTIVLAVLIVWLAIHFFAADYFSFLMEKYNVPKQEVQQVFLDAAERYLLWASLAALSLAVVLGFSLTRRVLGPLYDMIALTHEVAKGDYTARVHIASGDEIGTLAAAFNHMAESLERVERLRKNMVLDVAHELRVPLTNIRGYVEALTDGVLPPSQKTFRLLHDETLRLVTLAEDLLQLSEADTARRTVTLQKVSLPELLGETLDAFGTRFAAKGIRVETAFPAAASEVTADREKIRRVVANLVQNAWQYTPSGGSVRVAAERVSEGIRLTVANSGTRIAPEDLQLIFERFYRAEKSRSREHGGAGIGLAIVKELVEAHDGTVGAESSDSETRVWFTLPR